MKSYVSQAGLDTLIKLKYAEKTIRLHLETFIGIAKRTCDEYETAQVLGATLLDNGEDVWTFDSRFGKGRLKFKFDVSQRDPEGQLIFQRQSFNEKDEIIWVPELAVYFPYTADTVFFLNTEGKKQEVSLDLDWNKDIYRACADFVVSMIYTQVQGSKNNIVDSNR